ncbi:hypothetical protein RHS04_09629 [Rhizoctonia solani]|uniref:Uncharacterized protein n=1 Tax=Rhizoctonia solani TaxID=456999 RepID=A0A8H7GYD9_9AGAM|nr:hypothetical protein RHS04_09629 [Rhizoctonia solani]
MKLQQLQYAVQNEYTIPYLPHVFYIVMLLLLGLLIPLNGKPLRLYFPNQLIPTIRDSVVALVGSDVVTTLKIDPTIDNPWWMPRNWPSMFRPPISQKCQPASITDDMNLRTNSSMPLFKYVLQRAYRDKAEHDDPTNRIYPALYLANKLSNCEIHAITWRVEIPAALMRYQTKIYCSLGGDKPSDSEVPDEMQFIMTYNLADNPDLGPDDMVDYLSYNVVPEPKGVPSHNYIVNPALASLPVRSNSSTNILGVLDGMHIDLSEAIWSEYRIWMARQESTQNTYFVEWSAQKGNHCRLPDNSDTYNGTCGDITDYNRWLRSYGTTNDYGANDTFIQPFKITLINSFIALRDAIMIDLGNINTESNIYVNKTYFNEVIRVDPYHDNAGNIIANLSGSLQMDTDTFWNFCGYWGCVNTSWAEALQGMPENASLKGISLPYRPDGPYAPSVLKFRYLCPTFKRKSTTALLVSVFATTFTIVASLYTLFDLYMPKAEAHYQKRKQAFARAINRNPEDQGEEEHLVGEPMGRTNTFDSSKTLYAPVSQAEKEKDGRYD